MWTVIYVAQSQNGADELKNMLSNQGVLVKIRHMGKCKNNDGLYEILIPDTEVEDARLIIEQLGREF